MWQLKYLDVSNNKVMRFDKQIQKLILLRSLNLQGNSINSLQNGQFSGLKRLTDLDLSNNRLRYIHMRGGRINSLIELFVMMRASVEEDMFCGIELNPP
jgi:Leucine-rich repeat (LRR) protein